MDPQDESKDFQPDDSLGSLMSPAQFDARDKPNPPASNDHLYGFRASDWGSSYSVTSLARTEARCPKGDSFTPDSQQVRSHHDALPPGVYQMSQFLGNDEPFPVAYIYSESLAKEALSLRSSRVTETIAAVERHFNLDSDGGHGHVSDEAKLPPKMLPLLGIAQGSTSNNSCADRCTLSNVESVLTESDATAYVTPKSSFDDWFCDGTSSEWNESDDEGIQTPLLNGPSNSRMKKEESSGQNANQSSRIEHMRDFRESSTPETLAPETLHLVDRFMDLFDELLNSAVALGLINQSYRSTASGNNKPPASEKTGTSKTSQGKIASGRKTSKDEIRKGKRRASSSNAGDSGDGSDTGFNHTRKERRLSKECWRLGCPIFGRNPEAYLEMKICTSTGFSGISRMIQHLRRNHKAECDAVILAQDISIPTETRIFTEKMNEEILQNIINRDRGKRAERWRKVYKVIFPQDLDANRPSKYYAKQIGCFKLCKDAVESEKRNREEIRSRVRTAVTHALGENELCAAVANTLKKYDESIAEPLRKKLLSDMIAAVIGVCRNVPQTITDVKGEAETKASDELVPVQGDHPSMDNSSTDDFNFTNRSLSPLSDRNQTNSIESVMMEEDTPASSADNTMISSWTPEELNILFEGVDSLLSLDVSEWSGYLRIDNDTI